MNIVILTVFILTCFLLTGIEREYVIPYLKWIAIIPYCLIVANRSLTVPDTESYFEYFTSTGSGFDDFGNSYFEIGFQIFTKILKFIFQGGFILYLGVITLFNLVIIDLSVTRVGNMFKYEQEEGGGADSIRIMDNGFFNNPYFAVLPLTLYIAYYGMYVNAIVLRVGITFSLLFWASSFAIKERKNVADYFMILFLCVLSYFFHSTALIGFLVVAILLLKISFTKMTYVYIWLFIGLTYFSNLSKWLANSVFSFVASLNELAVMAARISAYEDSLFDGVGGISMKFMFFWCMGLLLILNGFSSKIYSKYLNVYLVGLAIFALFRSALLVERVTDYFLFFSFVVFYLFLIMQWPRKFWVTYVPMVVIQLIFILRIIK